MLDLGRRGAGISWIRGSPGLRAEAGPPGAGGASDEGYRRRKEPALSTLLMGSRNPENPPEPPRLPTMPADQSRPAVELGNRCASFPQRSADRRDGRPIR